MCVKITQNLYPLYPSCGLYIKNLYVLIVYSVVKIIKNLPIRKFKANCSMFVVYNHYNEIVRKFTEITTLYHSRDGNIVRQYNKKNCKITLIGTYYLYIR